MCDLRYLDVPAIVIDNGSGLCKAGMSGETTPRSIIVPVIGKAKSKTSAGGSSKDYYVGKEAQAMRDVLNLKYPIERGIISSWDDMEKIWKYVYRQQLKTKPQERPLLMSEPPLNPLQNRAKMTEVMFETLKVPAMYLSVQAILALYESANTTGLVLDCGDGITHAVPVFEGYCLPHAVSKLHIAGKDINDYLKKLLSDSGHSLDCTSNKDVVNEIKEQLCYVAVDPCEELGKKANEICRNFELPDGNTIQISYQLFRAPEILFSPSSFGAESPGVHKMVFHSVMMCDTDIHSTLYENMVLAGGSSVFPGFQERMLKELQLQTPSDVSVRVVETPDRKISAWVGASLITSLTSFRPMWVTNSDYKEFGPTVVQRRCF
ncbi:actin-related protein T2-like [Microcaecilia unicolor]|uniref:Actin-related protein T2-like n=1 Tax=Microcaecilia unicolor TaxID=1415580 RepID=A0A6P7WLQ9_9AMPH|nr:actin-related protein T2-like [Microcaecilia unicolor]